MKCEDLGPKLPPRYSLTVWDATNHRYIQWICSEKTYYELKRAKEEYKRKNDTHMEPYLIIRGMAKVDETIRM